MIFSITRRGFVLIGIALGLATRARSIADQVAGGFTSEQRQTVRLILQTIFRHESATDAEFGEVINQLEKLCLDDPKLFAMARSAITSLELESFDTADHSERVKQLSKVRSTSFYRTLYRVGLEGLYGSKRVWDFFGRPPLQPAAVSASA